MIRGGNFFRGRFCYMTPAGGRRHLNASDKGQRTKDKGQTKLSERFSSEEGGICKNVTERSDGRLTLQEVSIAVFGFQLSQE